MTEKLIVEIAKIEQNSVSELKYARTGDAGVDLKASESVKIAPNSRATVACGFAIAIPDGFAGLVIPRSGLAAKYGITVLNSPGLIDSGYRGEIKVVLANLDNENEFEINIGDRIAQLMIVKYPVVDYVLVESLDKTERGEDGFGSTGI